MNLYFVTHPNVVVSRDVPVPRWPLSELGRQRMRTGLRQPWVRELTAIYCSTEQKAIDGAAILAEHLALDFKQVEDLGENDRSATGFLPPDEFERVADAFFGSPEQSVRGWERRGRRPVPHRRRRRAHRTKRRVGRLHRHRLPRGGGDAALLLSGGKADRPALGSATEWWRQLLPVLCCAAARALMVAANG